MELNIEEICYRKNFLTEVIARIDFVSPAEELTKAIPPGISKKVLEHFPIEEPKEMLTGKIQIKKEEVSVDKSKLTEWNFYGRKREKRLTIVPNAIFVSYNRYEDYESFKSDFYHVMESVFEALPDLQPSRLGLRYINQIKLPTKDPLNWSEYINDSLLGMFNFKVASAEPARIFHNCEYAFDDFNLRFQFGVHNPDYPSPIRQKLFILDFDAYHQGLIEPLAIPNSLDRYHTEIQRLFEESITPETRSRLNESD